MSMKALAIIAFVALVCWSTVKGTTSKRLEWFDVSDGSALCNDFTRAGFFLRRQNTSDRWIIFLESGGLCYSNETCNRRFFVTEVSRRFNRDESEQTNILYENFDPEEAWNETVVSGREAAVDVVSPYMTSMRCFENKTDYFPDGFSVQGTDILDASCEENPLFCDCNHVVVPYCSSDGWLGNEDDGTRNNTAADGECTQCFDYNQQNGCFRYDPRSESIQFTYRGRRIFMSVIRDLLAMGMDGATEVVLAGSSAGGLGALNNAKWLQSELQSVGSAELVVIFDSAWFINFQGSIYQIFDGTLSRTESEAQRQNALTLLSVLESNEACADDRLGLPCCSSPFCLFTQTNAAGDRYYPEVPTFGIFSLYDAYLLAPSLAGLETIPNSGVGYEIDFLLTVGEYGGEMNKTVVLTESKTDFFSYYATQCLQHVYLATSTLWGLPGASVFGRASVELERDSGSFMHSVEAGIWRSHRLSGLTIQQALIQWYNNRTVPMYFRDDCSGLHCNNQCPETFTLGKLDSDNWPLVAKGVIVALVLGITILCVLVKGIFCTWLYCLQRQQSKKKHAQGDGTQGNQAVTINRSLQSQSPARVITLPSVSSQSMTTAQQAGVLRYDSWSGDVIQGEAETGDISVSCLDLHYEVTVRKRNEKNHRRTMMEKVTCGRWPWKKKEILKGISTYFKYGELTGIMGVSGSGKTTFLDLLTGRRKSGKLTGEIMINGFRMDEDAQEYFVANTGYVSQQATRAPYYEELTVCENLTLAAEIKLNGLTREEKFERVNHVMKETRMSEQADTLVGRLSGGEKRRLSVALQFLHRPKIIFLDEPTSGLDASSAFKLLTILNELANPSGASESPDGCKRAVILTIHQPRLDIFYMFDKLLLLSDGKIAYDGPSEDVFKEFGEVLGRQAPLEMIQEDKAADAIMDILDNHQRQQLITERYDDSRKKIIIREEICTTRKEGQWPTCNVKHSDARLFSRLAVLEARASKRANIWKTLYFPFIFSLYGELLGTVYLHQTNPFLVLSGFAAFSFASSLVMFPMLHIYYIRALEIFCYEYRDGVGRTRDLVLQGFCRAIALVTLPVVMCADALYFLMINRESYDLAIFGQVVIVNLALNQTWTALTILIICASPDYSVYLSTIVTSIAGFTAGFFIPIEQIPWWYRWLTYINPNYYGFSATAFLLLNDFKTGCTGSQFECYSSSGEYFLEQFSFENINPYVHILALLGFTIIFLLMAWFLNWVHYNYHKIWKICQKKHDTGSLQQEPVVVTGGAPEDGEGGMLLYHQENPTAVEQDITEHAGERVTTPASSWPPLDLPGSGAARVGSKRFLKRGVAMESEHTDQTEHVELEEANTHQDQANAEQVENNRSTHNESKSSVDDTAAAAEISRLQEENRNLQKQVHELRELVPLTQEARKLPNEHQKRNQPLDNLNKRTAAQGAAGGMIHPLQHRHAWKGSQPGEAESSQETEISGAAGGPLPPPQGTADPGGKKHPRPRGRVPVHPLQTRHTWIGTQPGEAESSQGTATQGAAGRSHQLRHVLSEGGIGSATIGSSNDYLIRRLNLRRKIVDERVKETQDILQRQFSMEYASSLNTY